LRWLRKLQTSRLKGSDKWGQGSGLRLRPELVLVVLIVMSLVGVYYYLTTDQLTSQGQTSGAASISTTGINCNDGSMDAVAQRVESDPRFTSLSNGLCYNYMGQNASSGQSELTFDYYNGTITYPCGGEPLQPAASQIRVGLATNGSIASIQLDNSSAIGVAPSCPGAPLAVSVVSVTDVESTIPAVPQLNVTLVAGQGQQAIASLRATLVLDGGSQSFQFVSPPATLAPGSAVSKTEIVLSGVSFSSSRVYPMTLSGAFEGGQAFSYVVHVEVANVP
jgi:hypothetical protein